MKASAAALLLLLGGATTVDALRVAAASRPLMRVAGARAPAVCMQAGEFKAGSQVRISGLKSQPEFNGELGTVEEFDSESGRYAVRTPSGKLLLLKPTTIQLDLTWNTALDEDGETYYWNAAGASQYEKPADFDPALAKNEGVYQAKEDGALYDDMVPDGKVTYRDGTKKPELSQTMRDKLINEGRALGADPNQKNPFLYVFAAVGLFVLAGAATFTG